MEGGVPSVARTWRSLETQLEGNAPKDQRHQHDENRKIEGRQNDGEGEGEGSEESDPAQDEPSFVAIPDRCDRVHHEIARRVPGRTAE
jgi:hypothetical protein